MVLEAPLARPAMPHWPAQAAILLVRLGMQLAVPLAGPAVALAAPAPALCASAWGREGGGGQTSQPGLVA